MIGMAADNFPLHPLSIMDGYSVSAPAEAGVYQVQERLYAGSESSSSLTIGKMERDNVGIRRKNEKLIKCFLESRNILGRVSYITTGAKLPEGSNSVVKVNAVYCCHMNLDLC